MRRAFAIFVLAGILTIPAVAFASRQDANDGTLSVRNGVGKVFIGGRGVVIGRFDSGRVKIFDPADGDPVDLEVWGQDRYRPVTQTTDIYAGQDVRFRIVGRFRVTVTGSDIDLSAVGHGTVGLRGDDSAGPDGTFWINDGPRRSLPNLIGDDPPYVFFDLSASG